jgi:hypothetical protein
MLSPFFPLFSVQLLMLVNINHSGINDIRVHFIAFNDQYLRMSVPAGARCVDVSSWQK